MALKTPLYKSCIPLFTFCLINWNNKCTAVPSGRPVPGFLFQLLFQRSNFGLQSSNCSFEFGLHSSLHLLQLALQLFVLPLQLLPSIFILLCSWALCCQLIVQLLCLQGWEWMLSKVLYAFREMTGGSLGWQFSKYLFRTTNNFCWHTNRKWRAEMSSTCCTAFLMRSPIASMLLCSSSSSSSSWAILASRRRFSSWRLVL